MGKEKGRQSKRLMAIASAGGHWVQLSRLAPVFEGHPVLYVTTMAGAEAPTGKTPVAVVPDASRSHPLALIGLIARLMWLFLKFRPNAVITTGAAPGLVALHIGKIFGAHTIWIDSIANSERLSLSGRMAGRCADLWLTQWAHLTEQHPRLQHFGSVI